MKIPTEDQIEVVISEMESDACAEDETHICDLCTFGSEMKKRSTEEKPAALDRFMITGLQAGGEALLLPMLLGGPPLLKMFRKVAHACFFLGYKTAMNMEAAEFLEKTFGDEENLPPSIT